VQDIVGELRRVVDEYDGRVLIGEIYLPIERLVAYYGTKLDGVHLPFNFQLLQSVWNARGLATLIDQYERALPQGGWPNWVLGNHDNKRIASRVGVAQARVAAMLLLTLRGTPTMYYGDELGMVDVPIPRERVQDPYEKNVPGLGVGRDPERTPMQWDGSRYAGFSTVEPWLPVSDDYPVVNVQAADVDNTSILTLYRRLLQLRRAHPALSIGDYVPVVMTGDLLAYIRRTSTERFLVALNLGEGPYAVSLTSLNTTGRIVLSTHLDRDDSMPTDTISLRANEGVLIALPAEGEHRV
jgi:alpha-glucosidase